MKKAFFLALTGALVGQSAATLFMAYIRMTAGTVSLGPGARVFLLPAVSCDVCDNIVKGLTLAGLGAALVLNRAIQPRFAVKPSFVLCLVACWGVTLYAHNRITDSLWMQGL